MTECLKQVLYSGRKSTIPNVNLNEYTSLDLEMGYIDSFQEIMSMETGYLQYAMALLKKKL